MMNKKVAIPVENGNMSTHFGHAKIFALIEVENNQIVSEQKLVPPPHEPGVLPRWLKEVGATDIITGGMGQQAIQIFLQQDINVFVGVSPKEPNELVKDLINNTLSSGGNHCSH